MRPRLCRRRGDDGELLIVVGVAALGILAAAGVAFGALGIYSVYKHVTEKTPVQATKVSLHDARVFNPAPPALTQQCVDSVLSSRGITYDAENGWVQASDPAPQFNSSVPGATYREQVAVYNTQVDAWKAGMNAEVNATVKAIQDKCGQASGPTPTPPPPIDIAGTYTVTFDNSPDLQTGTLSVSGAVGSTVTLNLCERTNCSPNGGNNGFNCSFTVAAPVDATNHFDGSSNNGAECSGASASINSLRIQGDFSTIGPDTRFHGVLSAPNSLSADASFTATRLRPGATTGG